MATPGETTPTSECIDRIITPLNACSLEVLGSSLVIGCYQLNEATNTSSADEAGDDEADQTEQSVDADADGDAGGTSLHADADDGKDSASGIATRSGELRLHNITASHSLPPTFGQPTQVVEMDSGVLDAKWHQTTLGSKFLGSACASGRIHIHQLLCENTNNSEIANISGLRLRHVASSNIDESESRGSSSRLALSLDWDRSLSNEDTEANFQRKIVSSYSDGSVSIHSFRPNASSIENIQSLTEEERWDAHQMFGCPSEVWTCCFAASSLTGSSPVSADGTNAVLSGGDDAILKLWDVRCLSVPMAKIGSKEFEAGVTAVSYHPQLENVFAVGSYDEFVRLYDIRKLDGNPLCRTSVGGGVWRIRWHPEDDERMLVGAMHGG